MIGLNKNIITNIAECGASNFLTFNMKIIKSNSLNDTEKKTMVLFLSNNTEIIDEMCTWTNSGYNDLKEDLIKLFEKGKLESLKFLVSKNPGRCYLMIKHYFGNDFFDLACQLSTKDWNIIYPIIVSNFHDQSFHKNYLGKDITFLINEKKIVNLCYLFQNLQNLVTLKMFIDQEWISSLLKSEIFATLDKVFEFRREFEKQEKNHLIFFYSFNVFWFSLSN